MTGNDSYDPFSFGQVKVGDTASKNGVPTPEDLLFDAPSPRTPSTDKRDTSWDLLSAEVDDLVPKSSPNGEAFGGPLDFGAEILNEKAPGSPTPPKRGPVRPPQSVRPPAVQPRPTNPAEPVKAKAMASLQTRGGDLPQMPANTVPEAVGARQLSGTPVPDPRLARRGRGAGGSLLLPAVLLGLGGSVAAWFYLFEHNVVFASLCAALGLVGAAFSHVWLRGMPR
jgi:hypothetical protein